MVTKIISNRQEILERLAVLCHEDTVSKLIPDVPVAGRFDCGDRSVIIEIYGEKIIQLSRSKVLRFRESDRGIDEHTEGYFISRSVKALVREIDDQPFLYDPLRITEAVMREFIALPAYQEYCLIL